MIQISINSIRETYECMRLGFPSRILNPTEYKHM